MGETGGRLFRGGLSAWRNPLLTSPAERDRIRLRSRLESVWDTIEWLNGEFEAAGGSPPGPDLEDAYGRTKTLIEQGSVVAAWQQLAALRQWEVKALDVLGDAGDTADETETHLREEARSIYLESLEAGGPAEEKSREIERLLTDNGTVRESVARADVLAAIQLLHQQYIGQFRREQRLYRVKVQFLWFMLAALASTFALLWTLPEMTEEICVGDAAPKIYLCGQVEVATLVLMGVLGASISGLLSLKRVMSTETVPETAEIVILVFGRIVTGGAAALVVFVFWQAGFLFDAPGSTSTVLAIAFVAGFSERLLLRAVEQAPGDGSRPRARQG